MNEATVLLLSKDAALIESIGGIAREIGRLEVVILSNLDRVYHYSDWGRVALVLIHHDQRSTTSGVVRLLRMLAAARRPVATVVLTDRWDEDETTELLRMGAADLLPRPFDIGRLAYLADVLTLRLRQPLVTATSPLPAKKSRNGDESDPMMARARRVASLDTTVLLRGEAGTGKSRLARAIHDLSPRHEGPFVTIRCSAIASDGIAEELFGGDLEDAARGLGTGRLAEAREGTLVLDDVDALSPRSQAVLIRWIEDDVIETGDHGHSLSGLSQPRLIATTRVVLADEVTEGRFRSDLFYRLNVIGLELPPLRLRKEEVGSLAASLLAELSERSLSFDIEAFEAIESHDWPGNVRELRETLESAVAHSSGDLLGRDLLPEPVRTAGLLSKIASLPVGVDTGPIAETTLAQTKREAEYARITQALEKHGNNRLRTAGELGISRMTLYKKLYKYGIIEQGGREGQVSSGRSRQLATSTGPSSSETSAKSHLR